MKKRNLIEVRQFTINKRASVKAIHPRSSDEIETCDMCQHLSNSGIVCTLPHQAKYRQGRCLDRVPCHSEGA